MKLFVLLTKPYSYNASIEFLVSEVLAAMNGISFESTHLWQDVNVYKWTFNP